MREGYCVSVRPSTEPNHFARRLFGDLPNRYDRLAEVLSLGQNSRWRRTMVDHIVPVGPGRILDVATGTAGVALELVARTQGHVVGVDLTEAMLRKGSDKVERVGAAQGVQLVVARAEELPFANATFDAVSFTYLLRYVDDPAGTLQEMARVLRPDGAMASLEFFVPPNRFWRASWWLYTRLALPAAGRLAGREWFTVGRFLGPNISRHYRRYPLGWTMAAWHDAGLVDIGVRLMSLGGGLVMWGTKDRG
jgi:demethylmenaquinone methyltransferase / 2-methoxy-6-polyprenyl-1,4-benzoquinol methylase